MDISDAKYVFKAAQQADDCVLMIGLHGIGKSKVVEDFCKEEGYHNETMFLSMMESGDLLGMPITINKEGSTITTWAQPDWFQNITEAAWPSVFKFSDLEFNDKEFEKFCFKSLDIIDSKNIIVTREELNKLYMNHFDLYKEKLYLVTEQMNVSCKLSKTTVLFLDELSRASLETRQASLQLVLERRLHNHVLPTVKGLRTIVIAADNPDDGNYSVDNLDPALQDRFNVVYVESHQKSWLSWARSKNINNVVTSFIAENKKLLHYMPEDMSIGASPRSWEKLSLYIDNPNISDDILFSIIKGKVGSAVGSQFYSYLKNYSKVVKVDDIENLLARLDHVNDIEKLGEAVRELIDDTEVIQKTELLNQLIDKYKDKDYKEWKSVLAVLYALDIEILNGFLKETRNTNTVIYSKITNIDYELNNKNLFKKIVKAKK